MPMISDEKRLSQAVPALVEWYAAHKISMPWREDPTPYHVWISEIMLQQTRIEAAIPYYYRFLEALPDIPSLAAVEDDKLLKLWQGLGYYSRARNLKKAAVEILDRYDGRLPADAKALRGLPGIGDYTAGAIASIAYGLPEPAVDGNVLRVVMRLTACDDDILAPSTRKRVAEMLRAVYPSGADAAALTALPGVGQAKAEAIVRYRAEHGFFAALQDVAAVSGISQRMVESWAGLACVQPPVKEQEEHSLG